MSALIYIQYFTGSGEYIGGSSQTLPDSLDWKDIAEKEVYIRYMGGMPPNASHAVINSQGQLKLLSDLGTATQPIDFGEHKRRLENVEYHVEERCAELGIDRTRKPRNQ